MVGSTHPGSNIRGLEGTNGGQLLPVIKDSTFKSSGLCRACTNHKDLGKSCRGDAFNVVRLLKACAHQKDLVEGLKLHSYIQEHECLQKNSFVSSTLVSMYARCGMLAKAQKVLEALPVCKVVTWNALITGYTQQGQGEEALKCFDRLQCDGHCPDAFTFTCALKACGIIRATVKGEEIHDKIVRLGMLDKNVVLGNALLDMYVRCGALNKARQVLEDLPVRDVVTWTALIAGYAQHGKGKEALKCFDSMQHDGHSPNPVSFVCALKACGNIGAVAKGEQIHEKICSLHMLEKNVVLGTALVDMYARCGILAKAHQVFVQLPVRNVVSWTTLIIGYAQQGKGGEALECFDSMQCDGHSPNEVTFMGALQACGSIGAAAKGKQIHDKVISLGMLEKNILLGTTLVDMYARCGFLDKAEEVFSQLPVGDVISWNALIGGYALQGHSVEVANCFERMLSKGVKPDSTTLSCVLNACSHSGLSDKAEIYFSEMSSRYGITPDLEHYGCMVDLFGRAGKFNKVLDVIKEMPSASYLPVWVAFLGACCRWGEVQLGRLAFEQALHLDKSNSAIYAVMAYIYIAAGMQEDADKIEVMRGNIKCLQ